ncbi:MAG: hypothetical protein ACTMKV_00470 [Sphingomonas parapaucimobilis]
MRIQPQHHDGEGTDASLYDFLTGLGHEPPATVIRPTTRYATQDLGNTVRSMRQRRVTPPRVDIETDAAPAGSLTPTLMVTLAIGMMMWIGIGLTAAYLAGRL